MASCGTLPEPSDKPSSVSAFAVGRWPATEKSASVESVAASERTPGARAATVLRSNASTGRRDSWSSDRLRPTAPGPTRSTRREPRRALTVTASSGTADAPIRTFATSRSSSPSRATLTVAGAMPIKRIVRSYCPPPSGNTMVKRPRASVVAWRVIWVSTERACTSAPASGWLSGPTTVPVMISVVVPTCAAARDAASESASARSSGDGRARIRITPDSPAPPPPPRQPSRATAPPAAGRSRSPLRRAPRRNAAQSAGAKLLARARSTPPRTAGRRRAPPRPASHPGRPCRRHTRTYERGPARDHPAPPIEVDEDHPVTRQEDMVGLEISVNRRGRHLLQPGRYGGGNRPNWGGELGPRPLDDRRPPPQLLELNGQGALRHVRVPEVILIERGHGPGGDA